MSHLKFDCLQNFSLFISENLYSATALDLHLRCYSIADSGLSSSNHAGSVMVRNHAAASLAAAFSLGLGDLISLLSGSKVAVLVGLFFLDWMTSCWGLSCAGVCIALMSTLILLCAGNVQKNREGYVKFLR